MHGCCCLVAKSCDSFVTPWTVARASSVHGISQARILEWVAISSSRISSPPRNQTSVFCIGRQILYHSAAREALLYVVVVKSLNHAWLFGTPRTVIHQAPLSMGFSRQEYWSGLPFPYTWYVYLILKRILWGGYCCYPHWEEEQNEWQRGQVIYPRSHSEKKQQFQEQTHASYVISEERLWDVRGFIYYYWKVFGNLTTLSNFSNPRAIFQRSGAGACLSNVWTTKSCKGTLVRNSSAVGWPCCSESFCVFASFSWMKGLFSEASSQNTFCEE